MNINLTLVVQLIHFFIAYGILTKLVFKPAFALINAQDTKRKDLRHAIVFEQEAVAALKAQKRQLWQVCQRYFNKHKPLIATQEYPKDISDTVTQQAQLTHEQVEQVAQLIATKLEEKVIHEHS